jgi:uncharacterized YigZ family protein
MVADLVPKTLTRVETEVANSRFIATAAPAKSVEEARQFISQIKNEFPDASHNVPAFVIGHDKSKITHSSDDGEPSGTAGRPVLSVLEGSHIGDIVVVVTRYFGGTKLGTGGLVRAYRTATQKLIAELPTGKKVNTYVYRMTMPYTWFERVSRLIENSNGVLISKVFFAEVTITYEIAISKADEVQQTILELSNGQLKAEIVEERVSILDL